MSSLNTRPYVFKDLRVDMSASLTRVITEAMINAFAEISGDTNPVHLDPDYAATTIFKERIAHGILTASLISAVLGTRLPGPGAIYVSQMLEFKKPVRIGDLVTATVRLIELIPTTRCARFECTCAVGDKAVLTGEAVLKILETAT